MARQNIQAARGSWQCQVEIERWGRTEVCGAPKRSHSDSVKRGITDHPYGGEDGTLIKQVLPVCQACQKTIEQSEQYRLWAPRNRGKFIRCMTCPAPSRSSMTGSEILAMAWDIADSTIDGIVDIEDAESARDDLASQIDEVVQLIQEKLDNIESGMGHANAPVYYELEERMQMYESWKDEVESLAFDEFNGDSEACSECGMAQGDHPDDADHEFEAEQEFDADGAMDLLNDQGLGGCPE